MMMNTNPSVAEIDATMNLLSVLELAKDASKLKTALQEIKDAQDALAAMKKDADAAIAKADKTAKDADNAIAKLEVERAKLDAEADKIAKNSEAIELDRAAMRDERNQFDRWMAEQREALNSDKARVESDRVANSRRAEDLQTLEDAANKRVQDAENEIAATKAKRAEYEAKMENLKAMVS